MPDNLLAFLQKSRSIAVTVYEKQFLTTRSIAFFIKKDFTSQYKVCYEINTLKEMNGGSSQLWRSISVLY
jgi:HKD family nuclease